MADDFWERAAREDPLWAILSDPSKRGRRWSIDEFMETGRREISLLVYELRQLGAMPRTTRALDFGCGVGRLTQALAATFDEVIGVDVSPTMVRLAEQLNRFGPRVRYIRNADGTLDAIASELMDFVYSDIVLQHLPAADAAARVADFLRVLRPGGVTVFQLTAERRQQSDIGVRPVAMPDAAYNAAIQVESAWLERPSAASQLRLIVTVTNASPLHWNQEDCGTIRVGNHWLDAAGAMLIQDDARVELPRMMAPGRAVTLPIDIRTPDAPGSYICEIDVVHEGITWFGDRGSRTLRRGAVVGHTQADSPAESGDVGPPAATYVTADFYAQLPQENRDIEGFPMHGISRETVLSIVAEAGGQCFHISADERGGAEWIGYRYFVRKPTAPGYSTEIKRESREAFAYPNGPVWKELSSNASR